MALADRATRQLHALLSKWARERGTGTSAHDLIRDSDRPF
jgi:hypothetical protein